MWFYLVLKDICDYWIWNVFLVLFKVRHHGKNAVLFASIMLSGHGRNLDGKTFISACCTATFHGDNCIFPLDFLHWDLSRYQKFKAMLFGHHTVLVLSFNPFLRGNSLIYWFLWLHMNIALCAVNQIIFFKKLKKNIKVLHSQQTFSLALSLTISFKL